MLISCRCQIFFFFFFWIWALRVHTHSASSYTAVFLLEIFITSILYCSVFLNLINIYKKKFFLLFSFIFMKLSKGLAILSLSSLLVSSILGMTSVWYRLHAPSRSLSGCMQSFMCVQLADQITLLIISPQLCRSQSPFLVSVPWELRNQSLCANSPEPWPTQLLVAVCASSVV